MPLASISPIEVSSHKIFLTPENISLFCVQPGSTLKIKAGTAVTDAQIITSLSGSYISVDTLAALGLPVTQDLSLTSDGPDSLRIGPLIGILVSRGNKYKLPPYSSQNKLLQLLLNFGSKTKCLPFVFFPAGVNPASESITGYYLSPGPSEAVIWKKHVFPLPDVVYDRILFRTVERKRQTKLVTSFLLNHNHVKYFNPKFLNKWETYSILQQNPYFHKHLPDTKSYQGPASLLKFLEAHQTVYVKPINGSLGKGILRLSHSPEGYCYQYRSGPQPVTGVWRDGEALTAGIKAIMTSPPYIMQQGLDLLKYQGRVFDIRVLMQKDGRGQWINSATVARVASQGSIFPNVAAGGVPMDISEVWNQITGSDWFSSQACSLTRKVSTTAGETLEKALGTFGEIGLDIGVDSNGNIWVIEINSKPSRKVFPKGQTQLKLLSLKLPIDFAKYLSGFVSDRGCNQP